jgi:hypothetical protein
LNERFAVARKPYNDFINKELQIEIHADKERPPQVLIKNTRYNKRSNEGSESSWHATFPFYF